MLHQREKQDIRRQINELQAAGADEVIFEYEHGDSKVKQNLEMLLDNAKEGDTIITLEVSRLSRSTKQLCEIVEVIRQKRLRLVIVGSITVDCRSGELDPMSQAFIQMSVVFAELELSIIRARVESGMANAKAKGEEGREVAKHEGGYSGGVLQALSGVCGGADECVGTGKDLWAFKANGV